MIYEVAWTRALSLVIGSSTYAFSTMLVAFLSGLAVGSYLFSRLAGRLRVDPFLFASLQLGIGVSALLVIPFFDRMPEVFLRAFTLSQSPGFVKALQFTISAMAMFLPALFMGATFPCVAQIASQGMHRVGYDVGRIYFINTGGAIAGSVAAGFLLVPAWGLQSTLKLAVSMNLSLALALFLASKEARWRRIVAACAPVIALAVLYISPPWNAQAMASGVAIYGKRYLGLLGKADFRQAIASANRLVFYRDGISATVSVHQHGEQLYLKVNGKTDASNRGDVHTQLMSGHLPLLLHPDPKRVLVIGLGSGMTAGAVALHPVEEIDVIEIEPAVVEAAGFFAKDNREVLKDPRTHLAIADGRNFLLASGRQYDVITSEPSNPWIRGIGNLFSLEFYKLVAKRLAPRGIVCQWIHAQNLSPDDVKMVVKTFRSVFPHTTVWSTTRGDLLLLGQRDPLSVDYGRLQARHGSLPGLREDMARLGFHSSLALLADFLLSEEDAARYAKHAWLNTDDLPYLEFSAPESLYVDMLDLNRRILKGFKERELPPIVGLPEGTLRSAGFRRELGLALVAKEMPQEALAQFDEAIRLDPRDAGSLLQRGRIHLRSGSVLRAEVDFKAALRIDPGSAEAYDGLGQLYKAQEMRDLAEVHLRKALALRPKSPRHLAQLADLYVGRQRFKEAIPHYLAAAALTPQDASLWSGLGLSYQGVGRFEEALEAFRRAVSQDPSNAVLHYRLGLAYGALKRFDEASAAFQMAALQDPLRPEPHVELGRLYEMQGEKRKALHAYRTALRLDPLNTVVLRSLEELLVSL
jgi:spermidine synthase